MSFLAYSSIARGSGRRAQFAFCEPLARVDAEVLLDQRREAEFRQPQHARGDHRVENFADIKIERASEQAQIEIHPLQHDLLLGERGAKRLQIDRRERIDQVILAVERELNEAELFKIAVQAVGLGIDRDALERAEPRKNLRELCSRTRSPQARQQKLRVGFGRVQVVDQ